VSSEENLVHVPVLDTIEDALNSYIFVFDPSQVSSRDVPEKAQALVNQYRGGLRHVFSTAIRGFSANMSEVAAARLASENPNIDYYEPNGLAWVVNPPARIEAKPDSPPGKNKDNGGGDDGSGGDGGGGSTEPPQDIPPGISRVGGPLDGSGLTAWIIDTGIDLDHPDLNVNKKRGKNFVSSLFRNRGPGDGHGHGTHVAGIVGAMNNSIDSVGIAAGATVIPIRVLGDSGMGTIDNVIKGVDYVAQNGRAGDCANLSLSTSTSISLNDAVESASQSGVYFAIAAGNYSSDADSYSPANAVGSNVFTISAVDSSDNFASFSNFGSPPIDYAAPGVDISSTALGGGVTIMSGTSMAAPHVCGLLMLRGGAINSDGTAGNDPDGDPDPIAHY
jgi:subtilisin family serine protease